MQTKTIDKLEDLKGYEWDFRNACFQLKENSSYLYLYHTNAIDIFGRHPDMVHLKDIDINNLSELEFYGLKVFINKKTGLTQNEKACLERFNNVNYYITRSKGGYLRLFFEKPEQSNSEWFFINKHGSIQYGIFLKYFLLYSHSYPFKSSSLSIVFVCILSVLSKHIKCAIIFRIIF